MRDDIEIALCEYRGGHLDAENTLRVIENVMEATRIGFRYTKLIKPSKKMIKRFGKQEEENVDN